MDSIHQAKVKSGHLVHKIALVQSQRNSTVLSTYIFYTLELWPIFGCEQSLIKKYFSFFAKLWSLKILIRILLWSIDCKHFVQTYWAENCTQNLKIALFHYIFPKKARKAILQSIYLLENEGLHRINPEKKVDKSLASSHILIILCL